MKEKTKVLSIRLPSKEYDLFKQSGTDPKQVIINHNKEYYSTKPNGLKIAKKELENREKEIESNLIHIKTEKERIDNLINNQKTFYDIDYYDNDVKHYVNNVIDIAKQKNKTINELDETVFKANADKCKLPLKEFKELCLNSGKIS